MKRTCYTCTAGCYSDASVPLCEPCARWLERISAKFGPSKKPVHTDLRQNKAITLEMPAITFGY